MERKTGIGTKTVQVPVTVNPFCHRLWALEFAVFPAFERNAFAETLFGTRQCFMRPAGQVDGVKDPVKRLPQTLTPVFCSNATHTPLRAVNDQREIFTDALSVL